MVVKKSHLWYGNSMILALSPEKATILIIVACVLIAHYGLAVFSTSRLLKYKAKGLPDWVWHVIVQLFFIVGPIVFLIIHSKSNAPRFDIEKLKKEKEEREAKEAAENKENKKEE